MNDNSVGGGGLAENLSPLLFKHKLFAFLEHGGVASSKSLRSFQSSVLQFWSLHYHLL